MGFKKEYLPVIVMVTVQASYAGLNVLSKLALDSGMSPYVLIAYRQIFATVALAPIAFLLEWTTCPTITGKILLQILVGSIFGATINQLLYFIGLKYTTSTIACALTNMLPAMIFIMAILFRLEATNIKSIFGQAKIMGTTLCVSGSMLMTFYKGSQIKFPTSKFHWHYAEEIMERNPKSLSLANGSTSNEVFGIILVVGSCIAWAAWFIIQAKMSTSFSAPYITSTLMCAMASVQCLFIGGVVERDLKRWALGFDIRLASSLYIGLVGSGLAVSLTTWTIDKRGPLYVSMFSPLLLIMVAIFGLIILDEKLFLGSALGSLIIVFGLYLVLWGKEKEISMKTSDNRAIVSVENGEENIRMDLLFCSTTPNANCEKEVQFEEA